LPHDNDTPGISRREREVRLYIYRHIVETSTAPSVLETAKALASDPAEIGAAYFALANARALVLRPDSTAIWMAMPFSSLPTAFSVIVRGRAYYASCAWDAFGIPALLQDDACISTSCPDCGSAVERKIVNGGLIDTRGFVHFVVPPREWWDEVGRTSATNLLFGSEEHVDRWCDRNEEPRGALVTLEQTMALAKRWYSDRMIPEWRPRTSVEMMELFASVGLSGEFWSM
jgi:hypothetical protein